MHHCHTRRLIGVCYFFHIGNLRWWMMEIVQETEKSKVQLYIYRAHHRRIIICLHGDQAVFFSKLGSWQRISKCYLYNMYGSAILLSSKNIHPIIVDGKLAKLNLDTVCGRVLQQVCLGAQFVQYFHVGRKEGERSVSVLAHVVESGLRITQMLVYIHCFWRSVHRLQPARVKSRRGRDPA